MINEERIKLETKMAIFEQYKKEDVKISKYFKHDYIGLRLIYNILWLTVGYVFTLMLLAIIAVDVIFESLTLEWLMKAGSITVGIYLLLVLVVAVVGHLYYSWRFKKSKAGMTEYYVNLRRLQKEYAYEDREQSGGAE